MQYLRYGFCLVIITFFTTTTAAQQEITLSIRDVIERKAILFDSDGDTGVVLAHQSGYNAHSWNKFARHLQTSNLASLALESISEEDVQSGIKYFHDAGKQKIVLVGASIGGGAVQKAATQPDFGQVAMVILLGTAEGNMINATTVEKLFVVTEGDLFAGRTHSSFRAASEPKELLVYPGSAHGQDMLNATYSKQLIRLILDRIQN